MFEQNNKKSKSKAKFLSLQANVGHSNFNFLKKKTRYKLKLIYHKYLLLINYKTYSNSVSNNSGPDFN